MYSIDMGSFKVDVFASKLEEEALSQLYSLYNHPALSGGHVAIMPDAHSGSGCVIGFTGYFTGGIIPSFVGVDMDCGVYSYVLPKSIVFDFEQLDRFIQKQIPMGFASRSSEQIKNMFSLFNDSQRREIKTICYELEKFLISSYGDNYKDPASQLGTMGGGNHFIEIEKFEDTHMLTVHSGSRNLGKKICDYFQNLAKTKNDVLSLPQNTDYLPFMTYGDAEKYLEMAQLTSLYAHYNKIIMIKEILKYLNVVYDESNLIKSVHNYVSNERGMWCVRKGAISAKAGERVVIPLSMKRGIVVGSGLGNPDFNYSAPHGAGRKHSRSEMKKMLASGVLTMDQFQQSMKGIWTSSVDPSTVDESDFAYKDDDDIFEELEKTVNIEFVAKPVYVIKHSAKMKADDYNNE